jgi:AcrR family transcriptional regulator
MTTETAPGRAAQRRRTRRAIVAATEALLAEGTDPSVNDIATRAEVSRRTVYLHFPTLDQLVLDATVGMMSTGVEEALADAGTDDPRERLTLLVRELYKTMQRSLPLGRKLIKLTVDAPPAGDGRRRGHRRIGWLEWAVEPARASLSRRQWEDLVSALAVVIGWESFVVLLDVRGLSPAAARRVTLDLALTVLAAALARAAG